MSTRGLQTELLATAGRLLLEYNESTAGIHRALSSTAKVLSDDACHVGVSYGGVVVSLAGEAPAFVPVRELRYNTALQVRVHAILRLLRRGELDPTRALVQLRNVEADTPRHSRWVAILVLGVAAAGLAYLLGADRGTVVVAGSATGMGLLARQELGRRHFNVLALPLTAALIGALLGGIAIRLGWTSTPGLALIVPALMVVPGPHLINGVLDLVDNHLPMSIARLWLAIGILLASALGIVIGVELTLLGPLLAEPAANTDRLNLFSDMALAGIVTCGFAVFYNTPWKQVAMAVMGGMAGHGLRFLGLQAGWTLEAATFLGGVAVGGVSGWMASSRKTPFAVIAFAGAVTMIPGTQIYRALSWALQLARQTDEIAPTAMAGAMGSALQACLAVAGLTLGLIIGVKTVLALTKDGAPPKESAPSGSAPPKPEASNARPVADPLASHPHVLTEN